MSVQLTQEPRSAMPLFMAQLNTSVIVQYVRAESKMHERLASMGIYPGAELKVLSKSFCGPCIVSAKDSQLVLDWQTSNLVMVG